MYNETSYEEYMRSVLGYRPTFNEQELYDTNDYYITPMNNMNLQDNSCDELYPEIYHKIYPLICKECRNVNMPVNNDTLERITDNVMKSIEIDLKIETKNVRQQEDRQTGRRNDTLRDLVRILILRELFGGGNFPNRPRPPRPPFPGGPGPGPRPPFPGGPIRPRDF